MIPARTKENKINSEGCSIHMESKIKLLRPEQITVRGDLCRRINLNYARLESKHYRPEHIFGADKSGWPGDWEGRTILALVKLKTVTGREPAYLKRILELLPQKLNGKGYLGPVHGADPETGFLVFDEQQLSGHNWLLRGLLEYYLISQEEAVKKLALQILRNLYLPLTGHYATYPKDPAERSGGGRYDGNISGRVRNWYISTDVGCAFMCLDAVSQAYEIFGDPTCKMLADEMIASLSEIDLLAVQMQTHATLSATRGILRMYDVTGEEYYLKTAAKIFKTYTGSGMTENYANINWFGRPDTWTEPCAIVDACICAMELYKHTLQHEYLALANRIYRNALCYAQRLNGGFGCDTCVISPGQKILRPHAAGLNEAFWCCTMRGAEGLSYLGRNAIFYREQEGEGTETVYINIFEEIDVTHEDFDLALRSSYPDQGVVSIRFLNKSNRKINLIVYNPVNDSPFTYVADPGPLLFRPRFSVQPVSDGKRIWHGDLLLGVRGIRQGNEIDIPDLNKLEYCGNGTYKYIGTEYILQPLTDMADQEYEETMEESRQILF